MLSCLFFHIYGKNKSYKERSTASYDYNYECYYWTNIPATCLLSVAGELYFGTEDGKICKFNTDKVGMDKYNDDGKAIVASWATKNDDDDVPHLYKSMTKKGCLVTIKPYTRSSGTIYACKDGNPRQFLRSGTMDILDWDDVDFDRFTFNTNDSPQDIFFKKKVKKYKRLQIIVENDGVIGWCKALYEGDMDINVIGAIYNLKRRVIQHMKLSGRLPLH